MSLDVSIVTGWNQCFILIMFTIYHFVRSAHFLSMTKQINKEI